MASFGDNILRLFKKMAKPQDQHESADREPQLDGSNEARLKQLSDRSAQAADINIEDSEFEIEPSMLTRGKACLQGNFGHTSGTREMRKISGLIDLNNIIYNKDEGEVHAEALRVVSFNKVISHRRLNGEDESQPSACLNDTESPLDEPGSAGLFAGQLIGEDKDDNASAWASAPTDTLTPGKTINPTEESFKQVAVCSTTSPSTLTWLASQPSAEIRAAVASNHHVPQDTLRKLSSDPDNAVRLAVASNKKTADDILRHLTHDENRLVSGEAFSALALREKANSQTSGPAFNTFAPPKVNPVQTKVPIIEGGSPTKTNLPQIPPAKPALPIPQFSKTGSLPSSSPSSPSMPVSGPARTSAKSSATPSAPAAPAPAPVVPATPAPAPSAAAPPESAPSSLTPTSPFARPAAAPTSDKQSSPSLSPTSDAPSSPSPFARPANSPSPSQSLSSSPPPSSSFSPPPSSLSSPPQSSSSSPPQSFPSSPPQSSPSSQPPSSPPAPSLEDAATRAPSDLPANALKSSSPPVTPKMVTPLSLPKPTVKSPSPSGLPLSAARPATKASQNASAQAPAAAPAPAASPPVFAALSKAAPPVAPVQVQALTPAPAQRPANSSPSLPPAPSVAEAPAASESAAPDKLGATFDLAPPAGPDGHDLLANHKFKTTSNHLVASYTDLDAISLEMDNRSPNTWLSLNSEGAIKAYKKQKDTVKDVKMNLSVHNQNGPKRTTPQVNITPNASASETIAFLKIVAGRISTPPGRLIELAEHSNEEVRAAVAENSNLPNDAFMALAKDSVSTVKLRLIDNATCPTEVLATLQNDADPYVAFEARNALKRLANGLLKEREQSHQKHHGHNMPGGML